MTPAAESLQKYISEKISNTLFLSKLQTNIDVNVIKGEFRFIYYIQVHISDENGHKITRKYEFR